MPTQLATACFGIWMALLTAGMLRFPAQAPLLWLAAGVSAVIAICYAVRRHRPLRRSPWLLLAAGLAAGCLGTFAYSVLPGLTGPGERLPSPADLVILGMYPLLAAALGLFVRFRSTHLDRGGLLDALTLTAGLALLSWIFLIGPYLRATDLAGAERLTLVAYPLGDVLVLAMLARLLTSPAPRGLAMIMLGAGMVALLGADVAFQLDLLRGRDGTSHIMIGWMVLMAAAGMAALHPSMIQLTDAIASPSADLTRRRIALLSIASLIAPAALLLRAGSDRDAMDVVVIATLSAVTFMLVLARLSGIVATHRQAIARERGLREASAALVSAAGPDEVASAVRKAVAQLLPADVPHRVVLAMAVVEPDGEDQRVVASRAEEDRATGTTARVVPTRELDWAVAIRLTQFSTVLRCPLVLQDRPNGDPLVGVLHVGGPKSALHGMERAIEVLASQVALALERVELSDEVTRRNSEAYFRTLILHASDVILIVDEDDRVRYASPSAGPVLGKENLAGTYLTDLFHPVDRSRLTDVLAQLRQGDGLLESLDFRAIGRRHQAVMVEMHCRDLRDDPTVAGIVLTLRDVTERRQLERELTHQAFHDALTGLANRVLFADRLEHALARARREGSQVGVLFLDLDDFKIVNDTLGHATGDELLKEVAQRLSGALRADDTAARLGGDEFAAIIEHVRHSQDVAETAERILAALAEPLNLDGEVLSAVASIGVTTGTGQESADELLRQADMALYVAKGAGKNQWRSYESSVHSAMVQRLELRTALDAAVAEGHFLLEFQPIVDLTREEAVGFEALVRWEHPVRGTIPPDQFIEVAEDSGLIVPIGRWVLDHTLHTVAQWQRVLPPGRLRYVSVNVSVRQFRAQGFVDQIRRLLELYGVDPGLLMLEITETLLMRDDEQIWHDLVALRELGVRVAIDDFGTGYSSLSYLRQRPIDVLKIDKSFIDDMVDSAQQQALVSSIVGLAHTLDLQVVAEGIETEEHRRTLVRMGCQLGQGYLFSKPITAAEAFTWLVARSIAAA